MANPQYNTYGSPSAGNPLRSLSPKTVTAIVLMTLMGILWLRVLTGGRTGPSAVQAAEQTLSALANTVVETPLHFKPVALPVIEGRNDTLAGNFFASTNWPQFNRTDKPADPVDDAADREQRQKRLFDAIVKTLNLDAILHAGGDLPPRVCINGNVLAQGQALGIKNDTETYELTVSEIGEHRVVLTWNQWSAVLKMAESERVD